MADVERPAAALQGGGTMRLSEAIRLGALLKPQGFGAFFGVRREWSCAAGAAIDAVGGRDGGELTTLGNAWSWVLEEPRAFPCPECGESSYAPRMYQSERVAFTRPLHTISHLNDDHRWSRERIAEWVATIEPDAGAPSQARERVGAEGDAPAVRHG